VGVGNAWIDEEKVGDFIVGTMIFGIVLTMKKIGLFGFDPVCFRSKQFNGDCVPHCTHCSNCSRLWLNGEFGVMGAEKRS
jgi:hypothetical protein